MKYEILPMQARHVPQIAALERLCFSVPWNEAAVGGELENPLSLWLVAEQNGAVLGYVGSQMVPPEARRQGIAEALIGELICRLSVNGVTSLSLEVRASNAAARSLYEKLGFRQAGLRPNYYFHPKEDACILRKDWTL